MPRSPETLLLLALAAIAVLVALVTWRKMNAFIALMLAAMMVGVGAGMAPLVAMKAFQEGVGATLGGIAAVIALGAMIGKLLAESGGAEVLAERFVKMFGPNRAGLIIIALALAVGLVTWFAIGLLLLLPILITLARETKRPFLLLAIPMLSFLSVMHGLMPPHPGPVVAVELLGANTGAVLGFGFLVGIPTAAIAGPLFARWVVKYVPAPTPHIAADQPARTARPSFAGTLFVVALPVSLMLLATVGELLFPPENAIRTALGFIGNPVVALTLSVFAAARIFGRACHFTRGEIRTFTEQSVAAIGMTLLVVAGGGGFARVLRDSGTADALGLLASNLHLPPLIYAWIISAFIRVATGSATVAITTAAGLLAPVVAANPDLRPELLVLSVGFGSLFLSHLNDGGFWLVKDCLGLTVAQTLRTWTVTETLIGIVGLGLTVLLGNLL
ncbi:MAG: gluconate:H+ symporter [Chthoniobacteraceae bacterium]